MTGEAAVCRAFPRLHFGLLDLAGVSPRAFGGCGVGVAGRPVTVTSEPSTDVQIETAEPLEPRRRQALQEMAESMVRVSRHAGCLLHVADPIPAHVSLGSGTALLISAAQAMNAALELNLTHAQIVALARRSGTSAVGTASQLLGGLCVDVGRPLAASEQMGPSSSAQRGKGSLILGSWPVPDDWAVTILFPSLGPTVDPSEESAFFTRFTPVSPADVAAQFMALYHGIIPSFLTGDIEALARHLREYQSRGFKLKEVQAQPPLVQNALLTMWDAGIACGLSSLGPTVFVLSRSGTASPVPPALAGHVWGTFPVLAKRRDGHG